MKKILLVLPFVLVGCATDIDYKIPVHRFMDPETRGATLWKAEFDGFAQISYQQDHKLTMTEVYDFGVFGASVNDDLALSETGNLGQLYGLGIAPHVDFHYRDNGDSPHMFLTKVQVLGKTAAENKEGFKLSFWGGLGKMDENEGSLTVENDQNGDQKTFSGKIEVDPWEVGLSLGYRTHEKVIIYLNSVYANYASKSTLESDTENDLRIKGDAILKALTFGTRLGGSDGVSCHLELGLSEVKWKEEVDIQNLRASLAGALSWYF